MSIATELTRIQGAKADIKSAIEAKGVTVPSNALIDDYDTYIAQISSGGGQVEQDLKDIIEGDIVTLNIPSGTTRIKGYLFSDNTNLTSVTIPNSVTSIGQYAFFGCTNVGTTDNYVKYVDGWAVDLTATNRSSYTIKEGTKGIIDGLFYSNNSVSTISLPSTLLYIPSYFVSQCNGISTITIPNSVTSIGKSAFSYCNYLTSVTIPNSVTSIGDNTFNYCRGLTSITIPSSVTSIGQYVFQSCTGLASVTVEATTPPTIGRNAFSSNASGRKIYVPSESVETYKAASGWSSYAEDIEAIPSN